MATTSVAVAPMQVAQIPKPGADFQIIEREIPKLGVGHVRIKVQACGICHSDVLTKEGSWPGLQFPRVLGHEVVGIIDKLDATPKVEERMIGSIGNPHSEGLRRRNMKILMVLTSHDQLGNTGRKTGFWLEEFAAPYFVFRDAGVDLTLASPKGGQPPIDPKSDMPENQTPAMARFKQDAAAQKALANTVKLADVKAEDYDTVFYVGGHGPMWDLAESPVSIALIESFYNSGKPVALVCHAPGVLHRVTSNGAPIVKGKRVTGFTNGEEEEVHLTHVVPFLVEEELKRLGAIFEKVANWQPFSIVDGRLVTGQNPASSTSAAQALLKVVAAERAA